MPKPPIINDTVWLIYQKTIAKINKIIAMASKDKHKNLNNGFGHLEKTRLIYLKLNTEN